ncbi:hypothetical protein LPJ69_002373 [Coemansia sp. RSA 1752]|nr:hypothetical protein LPJ69_002373 [Coemansia sp. RSA 1752]KAJ1789911.1 hypothetical protein LPJ67_002335 [Coemansia sp. RSA 1938]
MKLTGGSLALAVLALGSSLGGVHALFPDEAGRIDWYRAQIGVAKKMQAHTHNDTAYIYSITQRNAVAALRADDGQIAWRQVLSEPVGTLLARDDRVLTLSSSSSDAHVHVWDAGSGALAWGFSQAAGGGARTATFVRDSDDVIAVLGDELVRVAPGSNTPAWSLALNGTAAYKRIVVHGKSVFAIGNVASTRQAKQQLHVVEVDTASGAVKTQYSTAEGVSLGGGSLVVLESREYGAYLVWRESDNIVWHIHRLGMTSPMWEIYHAKMVEVALMPPDMLTSTIAELDTDPGLNDATPRFTLTYTRDGTQKTVVVEMYRTGDKLEMRKIASFTNSAAVAAGAQRTVAAVRTSADGVAWRVRGGAKHSGDVVYESSTYGGVTHAALVFVGSAPRIVVQTRGGLLAALAGDSREPVWTRDESLAHAADMALLALPPPASSAEHAAKETDPSVQPSAAIRFVLRWVATAQALVESVTSGFGIGSGGHGGEHAAAPTEGDHFGFRRLAVFGSTTGVVAAVGSQDGAHAWAHYLKTRVERVFITRGSQALSSAAPIVVAVGRTRNATVVTALDALTGKVVSRDTLPFAYTRVFELPASDPVSGQRLLGFAVAEPTPRLAVWPATVEAVRALGAANVPLYFELGDGAGSTAVQGFRAEIGDDVAEPWLAAQPAWTFDLPAGETLISTSRYEDGAFHTALQGRVLGDRSVLYKYINPHVGALATQRSAGGIGVYLIDRVSGRLLHAAEHAGALVSTGHPFLATLSENRVIYQFWQPGAPAGYVTAVVELFESDQPDTRDERTEVSSLDLRLPSVVATAFVAPEAATALGTTRTGSSITTRDVLFALASGKLLALPDAMLDPRRPMHAPTKDEQAEGLVAYSAPLPLDPRRVLSHSHAVAGIAHVRSAPTHLESTSLVAAFGLDVFFTRTSPSGTFDQLSPSFSKANLVITSLALVAGCLLGAPMVRRKLTNRAWA